MAGIALLWHHHIGKAGREGSDKGGKILHHIIEDDAELFLQTARNHWAVENGLHWRLDVDFQEDKSRKKKNAAINFSLVNKMAMAILSFDKKKEPLRRKRQRAALKEEYLKQLLGKLEEIV